MVKKQPTQGALDALRKASQGCRNCPLWQNATQAVFGEGSSRSRIMFVGEQPGDQEDLQGHPFVGPAGRILDEGLAEAGIDRRKVYVTNVVKHFKWEPRGKRRLHKTPAQREIEACYQWLEGEMSAVKPRLIVALGATAAKALLGPRFRITQQRGQIQAREGLPDVLATYHPSFLLRVKSRPEGEEIHGRFVHDLRTAAQYLVQEKSDR
ncbi:MAG TPA: UdgX family uracil-DNA binding protein [Usitatibacter sp.]|nr:UdgX family uracil-DNA binding protein [Usitatibacter sp.]